MAIWLALMAAALGVPRPAEPTQLPAPRVDRRLLALAVEEQHELAEEARRRPLGYEVRAVGELFRRYGKLEARGGSESADALLKDLRSAASAAHARGPERELSALLSLQTELFLDALARWEKTAQPSTELDELAGGLLAKARQSGWVDGGQLLWMDSERRVFFRLRWVQLTGLRRRAPFVPSLDEWRIYYGFLLERPGVEGAIDQARLQLGYVSALSTKDPSYPARLAQGVLQYRLGAFAEAADAFSAALTENPEGAYALRTRNHLMAALAKAQGAE